MRLREAEVPAPFEVLDTAAQKFVTQPGEAEASMGNVFTNEAPDEQLAVQANKKPSLLKRATVWGGAALSLVLGVAPPAAAESDVPPKIVGVANATFHEVGEVQAIVTSSANAIFDPEGRTYLYPVHSGKAPDFTRRDVRQAPFVDSYKEGKSTGDAFRLRQGEKFPTTYIKGDGKKVNIVRDVRQRYSAFAPDEVGNYYHMGHYDKGTKDWEDRCENPERKKGAPKLKSSEVHIVQKDKVVVKSNVHLSQNVVGAASATVEITKQDGKCTVEAGVGVTLSQEMDSEVLVKAKSVSEARIKAIGKAVRLYAANHDKLFIDTTLSASGQWELAGQVSGTCEITPGGGDTPPPPPEKESKIKGITTINDVKQYNYRYYDVSTLSDGNAMVYSFPRNGGTITANQAAQVGPGFNTITAQYTAGERPAANPKFDIPSGFDRVDVELYDMTNNKTLDEAKSNVFEITVPIPDPLKHDKGAQR